MFVISPFGGFKAAVFWGLNLAPVLSHAATERFYKENYRHGQLEHVLSDRTRVDCLTGTHAIEFDFGRKWSEAIGQSLGYAIETNKKAGIVLTLEEKKDYKYWIKLNTIIDHYKLPIDAWKIEAF